MSARRQRLGLVFGGLAVLCGLLSYRMNRPAEWLLTPPETAGIWEVVETPLLNEVLQQLALPKAMGLEFRNPLDERVTCQLIAPRSFEAYREPAPLSLCAITAQREIPLFGPNRPVRAWILQRPQTKSRMMVFAWLQDREGNTKLFGTRGMNQGILDRLNLGYQSVLAREAPCLVRIFAIIPPSDTQGIQTRRNLEEVAKAIYSAGKAGGAS